MEQPITFSRTLMNPFRGSYVSRHLGDIRDADIEASTRDILETVWEDNIRKNVIIILDNFQSHKAKIARQYAEDHGKSSSIYPLIRLT
jgi:hypothetical protein